MILVEPVTTPETEPTDATPTLLLVQLPAPVTSLRLVVSPAHTEVTPVIGAGVWLTVTKVVARQPVLNL